MGFVNIGAGTGGLVMYAFLHRRFQKIIGLLLVTTVFSLFGAGCASVPSTGEGPVSASSVPEGRDTGNAGGGEAGPADTIEPGAGADGTEAPGGAGEVSSGGDASPAPPATATLRDPVEITLMGMSLRQKVGQMVMPGLPLDSDGAPVTTMTPELRDLVSTVQPGGFILFGQNIVSVEQVRRLVSDLHASVPIPLIVATDQEGGIVRRVVPGAGMPATPIPSARIVGAAGDAALAFQLGRVVGEELYSLGITMNFAPVADVLTNPDNPVIGSRAYGSDPAFVGTIVAETVRGMQGAGVSAVLKHFPGHGDTYQDSHEEAAIVSHDLARLQAVELVPFRRGIAAGADAVMVGHITAPAVSGSRLPATLDPVIVQGLLRERMGFNGVIVTDSLTMQGLTRYYADDEIAVRAVSAGADILLRPADPEATVTAIAAAVESGQLTEARIDQSVRRILRLKVARHLLIADDAPDARGRRGAGLLPAPVLLPDRTAIGTDAHRRVVEEIRARAQQ